MLINFTNHPYDKWDERQRIAASVYGDVVDMPFPMVDEKADEADIVSLAEDYMQKILSLASDSKIIVHIMGELTFTFAMIQRLQLQGITCIASTSKRIVKEISPGNKEVVFKFERFRNYE